MKQTARAEAEWLTVPAPELRIVSDELWTAVHERLNEARESYLRSTNGKIWGRPERSAESKYLLTGLARCAACNGSLYVKSRSHGRRETVFLRLHLVPSARRIRLLEQRGGSDGTLRRYGSVRNRT